MSKRVVVTGMGAVTALGSDWNAFRHNIESGKTAISTMDNWNIYDDLNTKLGAPISGFETPKHYSRKQTRTMGRVALMATAASEMALQDSGLLGDPLLNSGRVGVAYGSSTGSTSAIMDFGNMLINESMKGITGTTYIRMMSHTTPVNIGIFFGLKGRIITTSSACTSGSYGIGSAYELIKHGKQVAMLAGGAEELCASEAAIFDTLYATSVKNKYPELTPRPFDEARDGLVVGEGAGTLILEEREHAMARNAPIYAEILGFGTNSDGGHVTQPNQETMGIAMKLALEDADISPKDIQYINAHGTATDVGDIAESNAVESIFGSKVPISTLKGHIGHTLGACGAIESWATINMLNDSWFPPTRNLDKPDKSCGTLDYVMSEPRRIDCNVVMTNNFAFGGINTSLVIGQD